MTFAAVKLERIISASAARPDARSPLGASGHLSAPTCNECNRPKQFQLRRGKPDGWRCNSCVGKRKTPEQRKQYRLAWEQKNREKSLAHKAVWKAVSQGKLLKQPCQVCGISVGVHAHHDDYSRRLEIMWLCPQHHKDRHRELNEAANAA